MNRRDFFKLLSVAGVSASALSEKLVESVLSSLVQPAHAQATLPDSFVGIDLPAKYMNQRSPSPIDFLISEAHAKHIPIPNPWNIRAKKNGENTYRIEIVDSGAKAVRAGTFNVDGSKGSLELDTEQSCDKLEGRMSRARIRKVSPKRMIFQADYRVAGYDNHAILNWKLIPGSSLFSGTNCT